MSTMPFIPVRDVMSRDPASIEGLATVRDALGIMRDRRISALVVKRRDERDEFGLLHITDIAREIISRNRSMERVNVYEIMIKPSPAVDADMDIRYAIRFMSRAGLSHCIVLEGRELAGVVTLRDMALRYVDETGAG